MRGDGSLGTFHIASRAPGLLQRRRKTAEKRPKNGRKTAEKRLAGYLGGAAANQRRG